ncbi:tRNA 2-selenouridine(34) synthase MnmH [Lacimicrobium sp. SS2-24]|uniref:tRNA 2-selenouridine(34) synthase MnmH n=1 Tax=Lacimicrobium sp. SS2-24 TaxID=2005569 RepID=UPI000B4B5A54|nr:tRNA 2-selenouridine(34) synthase MnmH [Lacimicrobium sp. SS2-24]
MWFASVVERHELISDYRQVFLSDQPLIDLRAPAEFAKGSFPHAQSLPLMTDEERAKVGTCYKYYGQAAAIKLGHKLVSGDVKAKRIAAWLDFCRVHPQGALFCWRGGLRSEITQQWLAEAGMTYPRVAGGYKALRRFLIEQLEQIVMSTPVVLLAGRTGCGKTQILQHLSSSIDLEGLARHRGSSFGAHIQPQPSQINFENALAVALLKHRAGDAPALLLEDESGHIGSLTLPLSLREKMAKAPVMIVETPLAQRIENIFSEYIVQRLEESLAHYGPQQGFEAFAQYLQQSLHRIRRRLGMEGYQQLQAMLADALQSHRQGNATNHYLWIERLLTQYYDPMYDYQLTKQSRSCLYSGSAKGLLAFWQQHQADIGG